MRGHSSYTMLGLPQERRTLLSGMKAPLHFGYTVVGPVRATCRTCGGTTPMPTDGRSCYSAAHRQDAHLMWQSGIAHDMRCGCMVATGMHCWQICGPYMQPRSVGQKCLFLEGPRRGRAIRQCGMTAAACSGCTVGMMASSDVTSGDTIPWKTCGV